MREKSAAVSLHDFEHHRQAPCPNVQLAPEANGGNISFQFETADFKKNVYYDVGVCLFWHYILQVFEAEVLPIF